MAGETIELRIALRDDATAGLNAVRTKALALDGAVKDVSDHVDKLRLRQIELTRALAAGANATGLDAEKMRALRNELATTTEKLHQLTTVQRASSTSAAVASTGMRNFGQAGLEVSRAIEDLQYGIGGVINNIPSLVMGLGAGAGLAGAASLAAVGINQLVKYLGNTEQEVIVAADVFKEFEKSSRESVRSTVVEMKKLRDEVKGLQLDLRALESGVSTGKRGAAEELAAAIEEQQGALKKVGGRARLDRLLEATGGDLSGLPGARDLQEAQLAAQRIDVLTDRLATIQRMENEQKRIERDNAIVDAGVDNANRQQMLAELAAMEHARREADALIARLDVEAELSATARDPLAGTPFADDDFIAMISSVDGLTASLAAMHSEVIEIHSDIEDADAAFMAMISTVDGLSDFTDTIEIVDDWGDAWVRAGHKADEAVRSFTSAFGSLEQNVTGASAVAVEGIQQIVTGMITGQEHIAERFAVLVMGQAGQSLISSGIKLLGEATVSAFTPGGQALAAAQAGAGVGLIGAGIGLGGVAAGIDHVGVNGGQLGRALPDRAGRGEGARASRGSSSSSQQPQKTEITIVYGGPNGPVADSVARSTVDAWRRAGNRGIRP